MQKTLPCGTKVTMGNFYLMAHFYELSMGLKGLFKGAPVYFPESVLLQPICMAQSAAPATMDTVNELHDKFECAGAWARWAGVDRVGQDLVLTVEIAGMEPVGVLLLKDCPPGRHARRFYRSLNNSLAQGDYGNIISEFVVTTDAVITPIVPVDYAVIDQTIKS